MPPPPGALPSGSYLGPPEQQNAAVGHGQHVDSQRAAVRHRHETATLRAQLASVRPSGRNLLTTGTERFARAEHRPDDQQPPPGIDTKRMRTQAVDTQREDNVAAAPERPVETAVGIAALDLLMEGSDRAVVVDNGQQLAIGPLQPQAFRHGHRRRAAHERCDDEACGAIHQRRGAAEERIGAFDLVLRPASASTT